MSSPQDSMATNVQAIATPQKDSIFPVKHEIPTVGAKLQIIPFLKNPTAFKGAQIALRLVAIVATFTAMMSMLTSHQSAVILGMQFDARYSYSPAFKFFVFANAIACFFILISLFPTIAFYRRGTSPSSCYYLLFLNDMMMFTLVIAGCGAGTATGDVGLHGNSHTGWAPICDHFSKFCGRVTYSLAFSYVSAVSLFMLTVISAFNFKQSIRASTSNCVCKEQAMVTEGMNQ